MLYEQTDFSRFCLPLYWYYYLNELGQGIAVRIPLKLKPVLKFSKKRFIFSNGELRQAPRSPVENVVITVNRRECDSEKQLTACYLVIFYCFECQVKVVEICFTFSFLCIKVYL